MKRKADLPEHSKNKKRKYSPLADNFIIDLLSIVPDEIILQILSYLKEPQLRQARLINQRLFGIIDMRQFSIGLVLDSDMPDLIKVFGRYDRPIGLTLRKTAKLNKNVKLMEGLTQLTHLDINLKDNSLSFVGLTNLQSLSANVALLNYPYPSQLRSLVVESINDCQLVQCMARLEQLTITYTTCEIAQSLLHYCSRLTELKFFVYASDRFREEHDNLSCGVTGLRSLSTNVAITNLPVQTLTKLKIMTNLLRSSWDVSHLTNLKRIKSDADKIAHLTTLEQLESLTCVLGDASRYLYQCNRDKITSLRVVVDDMDDKMLSTFTNLRRLHIKRRSYSRTVVEDFCSLNQLSSLKFTGDSFPHIFKVELLSNLTNLQELKLSNANSEFRVVSLRNLSLLTKLMILGSKSLVDIDVMNMTNLQKLHYIQPDYKVIGLHSLTNLTSLGIYKHLEPLTTLLKLTIEGATDASMDVVSLLPRLTYLKGSGNYGTGLQLTRLTRLQVLDLDTPDSPAIQQKLKQELKFCYYFRCIQTLTYKRL